MEKKLSKVEIDGIEALFYDEIMQLISGFTYNRFIKNVIRDMDIAINDTILDLGCGTAKNLCLMKNYTYNRAVGFDTSKNMIKKAKNRCKGRDVNIFYHDIREPHPFKEQFDIVFISFVLHGFVDSDRDKIIKNAYESLKNGGRFCILDYNEFNLNDKSPFVRWMFKYGECPLATEFISINLKEKLKSSGFRSFTEKTYYSSIVRLLIAEK